MENMFDRANDYNNMSVNNFEGLSPSQMHDLLYGDLGTGLIKIREIVEEKEEIPLLKQILLFLKIIDRENGLKLTNAGYIPPRIIKELYAKEILKDRDIESGLTKLSNERKSESIQVTRIICELYGFVRKSKGEMLITKKGKEYIKEENKEKFWLKDLLNVFGKKFNLGYFDGYDNEHVGQIGFQFSIYLLKKYGDKEQDKEFYAKKYFKAFPQIGDIEENFNMSAYASRTFDRFLRYFGLVEIIGKRRMEYNYKKTKLFDKYIEIKK